MKKFAALLLAFLISVTAFGCAEKDAAPEVVRTIESEFQTYYEMSDGTWQHNGNTYKYRLEITGRMPNAAIDSTFVYLSNIEHIDFQRAYMAAGLSSLSTDYFSADEAVLVDWQ